DSNHVGNIWYGTEGVMVCSDYSKAIAFNPKGEVIKQFSGGENHFGNFIRAVRSRKVSDLNADILEGHLSSALCHLGNISYRLGHTAAVGEIQKELSGSKHSELALETFERTRQHLADNGLDLEKSHLRLGPL